jgi:hypothetical protein
MGQIKAKATTIDFLHHARRANVAEPGDRKFDVIAGVVDDWTATPVVSSGVSTTLFTCLHAVGRLRRYRKVRDYDLHKFKPEPEAAFRVPKSFAGMSGGGIWRFYFQSRDTKEPEFIERRLVGVAFWEFPNGTMVGHGPRTLFDMLWKQMGAKWL